MGQVIPLEQHQCLTAITIFVGTKVSWQTHCISLHPASGIQQLQYQTGPDISQGPVHLVCVASNFSFHPKASEFSSTLQNKRQFRLRQAATIATWR